MDGILNIYKEKGFTSHDVVAKLRGILKQKKIGHTGTLDPEAEGVLPVCLGKATKVCGLLTDRDKVYEAVLLLGVTTDTQDTGGQTISTGDTSALSEDEVREAIRSFVGDYSQIPPMYSALKVGGRKLYELAREGREVARKPRAVRIYDIELLKLNLPRVRIRVECSKGTYIRTLCHDIGGKLGCGGCMGELLRTKAGGFALKDSLRLSDVERLVETGGLSERLIPIDAVFAELPAVCVTGEAYKRLANGNPLPEELVLCKEGAQDRFSDGERVRVYDADEGFAAVYRYERESGHYRPVKMFR